MRPFETVSHAHRQARKRLPKAVYEAILAGSQQDLTLHDNIAAFAELGLSPHAADLPPQRDLSTTVLGQKVALPVLLSPAGALAVHPDGEVAAARAAAAHGTALGLSSFSACAIEDVIAANPRTFMQLYWIGGRDALAVRLDRARAAGVAGLILTTDWSFPAGKDRGTPTIPRRLDPKTVVRLAPGVMARPRWLLSYARRRQLPSLAAPNLDTTFADAFRRWAATPPPSWEDIAWLRTQWSGPFVLKGIMRVDDAKRAVQAGVDAISVSNHGGNNVDGTPASIRALPAIAGAVGDQVEVLLDGGIRRGGDVAKALALGARAVLIGRAYLWGLAAAGEPGVHAVLDILRQGLDSTLLGLGCRSVRDLTADHLVVPPDFTRRLG
jgi:heme/flavin dehydrogenase (mycofactocin system)